MQADLELVTRAVAPIVKALHALAPADQPRAIQEFDEDQRALFAFWMLHAHSREGLSGCGREIPHRIAFPASGSCCAGASGASATPGCWRSSAAGRPP